jgi:tetratricopeptide (TPR) repeat protein
LDPYAAHTIDIRGVGDYSAAKLLRDALDLAARDDVDEALQMCSEAAELAPGYHEVARVEAYLHELSANFGEAFEAYSRAKDLAPDDSHVAYFFGNFLIGSGFDPPNGIRELQRAATLDPDSSHLHLTIANAFARISEFRQAMDAAAYAIAACREGGEEQKHSLYQLWRTCALRVRELAVHQDWAEIAENAEFALTTSPERDDVFELATLDLMLWVEDLMKPGASKASDDFIARRIASLVRQVASRRVAADSSHTARRVGAVENLVEKRGFGFLRSGADRFFFHARSLWDREKFETVVVGSVLVFTPGPAQTSGKPEATSVHWVW